MRYIINDHLVLLRAPEGPLAPYIASFSNLHSATLCPAAHSEIEKDLASCRGPGPNSVRLPGRLGSASSRSGRPAEDLHAVVPAKTRGAAFHHD